MATDKRLDQVSTLTDFDYALIVKGDQVAKASKQQLAELVGNLLYGATNASSLATVVAGEIGIIRQSNGNYLLGNKDSSGLFLVVAESDYALYSYNMIYGSAVNYNRIAGELRIENVNNYGTVVSPNGFGFYAVRFER